MTFSGTPYIACAVTGLAMLGCAARSATAELATVPTAPPASVPASAPPSVDRIADQPAPDMVVHVVEPGQTLWRIARVYGVGLDELQRANGIDDASRISEGASLRIPGADRVREVPPFPAPLPELPGAVSADVATPLATVMDMSAWIWPVPGGQIVGRFGDARHAHRHEGLDIRGRTGQPILAARAGRISYCGSTLRGYGKAIVIDHGDGTSTLYGHNSDLLVREGQQVAAAQEIARLGSSGNATTAHCHFEVRKDDRPVDPLPLFSASQEGAR